MPACLPARELHLSKRMLVVGCVDELHLAVLADPDAGLRRLDFAAAYALPCLNALDHRRAASTKQMSVHFDIPSSAGHSVGKTMHADQFDHTNRPAACGAAAPTASCAGRYTMRSSGTWNSLILSSGRLISALAAVIA